MSGVDCIIGTVKVSLIELVKSVEDWSTTVNIPATPADELSPLPLSSFNNLQTETKRYMYSIYISTYTDTRLKKVLILLAQTNQG